MIWELNLLLCPLAFLLAFLALEVRDLLGSVILLGAFSTVMVLIWAELGSPDVAFTEAAVGAGVSTALLIAAVLRTTRRSRD